MDMKIYISEKDIKQKNLDLENEDFLLMTGIKEKEYFEICGDVGEVKISLLEKHDKKIRNQVIDELLDWCLLQVKDDLTSTEKAITYSYFIDKLTEMRGGNNER